VTVPPVALRGARIFDGEGWWDRHALVLRGDRIDAILPAGALPADMESRELDGGMLVPGLVDLQVNGGGGVQFNEHTTADAIHTIALAHRRAGTTAWLPTLISDSWAVMQAGAYAALAAHAAGDSGVVGLHLEGPFLTPARRGVHASGQVRRARAADIAALCELRAQCAALPAMLITLAPEQVPGGAIRDLCTAGFTVFAGHSAATAEQVTAALAEGLRGFTHLFNGMPPLAGRAPGIVASALLDPDSWCSVIADGHHLHPDSLRLALRAKPRGKLALVSDAMAPACSTLKDYHLGGELLTLRDGALRTADGTLAGSAGTLLDSVRYLHDVLALSLDEALRMACCYPAAALGLSDRHGSLQPGSNADVVHLGDDAELRGVWYAGRAQPAPPYRTGSPRQKHTQ